MSSAPLRSNFALSLSVNRHVTVGRALMAHALKALAYPTRVDGIHLAMGPLGSKPPQAQVLMLGLDGAGKSTLLYRLRHDARVNATPTVGFNVAMLEARRRRKNVTLTLWDVGGQPKMREHWMGFHPDAGLVVFVVDSSARGRLREARGALESTLGSAQLRGRPLLVLANKQDVDGALTVAEITDAFNLRKMCSARDWFVQPCSATTGFGVEEAAKRVAEMVKLPADAAAMKDNIKETMHYLRSSSRH